MYEHRDFDEPARRAVGQWSNRVRSGGHGHQWRVLFAGTAALVHDRIYVVVPDYIYSFNLTGWAWVHLALGILAIAAGYALLRDRSWARVAGMLLACLSMVFQFLVLPFYPIWSLLIIALDATILWALTTDGRNAVQDSGSKRPHGRAT
jgi:hypothetical protein